MSSSHKIHIKVAVSSVIGVSAAVLLNQSARVNVMHHATVPARPSAQDRAAIDAVASPMRPETVAIVNQFIVPIPPVWNSAREKQFHALAVKDALNEISPAGKAELESLNCLRRRHDASIDPEQSFLEFQQRRITRQLMGILEKYVEFHRPHSALARGQNA